MYCQSYGVSRWERGRRGRRSVVILGRGGTRPGKFGARYRGRLVRMQAAPQVTCPPISVQVTGLPAGVPLFGGRLDFLARSTTSAGPVATGLQAEHRLFFPVDPGSHLSARPAISTHVIAVGGDSRHAAAAFRHRLPPSPHRSGLLRHDVSSFGLAGLAGRGVSEMRDIPHLGRSGHGLDLKKLIITKTGQ